MQRRASREALWISLNERDPMLTGYICMVYPSWDPELKKKGMYPWDYYQVVLVTGDHEYLIRAKEQTSFNLLAYTNNYNFWESITFL